jgi:hypothetical protein
VAKNVDRVLLRRDVQGLVKFGVELGNGERRKLAKLQDNLAPDFIILDEGKKPEVKKSVGYLALGSVMGVIGFVIVRRGREPEPAETY